MKRALAISALALSLVAFGCDDEGGGGGTGGAKADSGAGGTGRGGAGGGTGGSGMGGGTGGSSMGGSSGAGGGSAGAGGSSGAGGGSAIDGGDATTGDTGDGAATETGGETGAAVSWTTCSGQTKPGVSAMDFCTQYGTACMFQGGANSFANMGACMTRYMGYNDTQKSCAAGHLCLASQAGGAATHCPHPAQVGMAPCNLPGM